MKSITLLVSLVAASGAALAQGPGHVPLPPPAHVQKSPHHQKTAPAAKNPSGIVWDAKTRHFVDKSGKVVTKAEAHKAGVRGPATTPPSHPKTKMAPTPAPVKK